MTTHERPGSVADGNTLQAAAWNGPEGSSWAGHSSRRPADGDLVPVLLDAAELRPDDWVLDVGCGTGELTRRAAASAPRGESLGIDLSTSMVEDAWRATAAAGLHNARFVVGDAQVHQLRPGSFDRVLSHFGVMFFADPVAGFRNLASTLRTDGRLLFVCPQEMESCAWYRVPLGALLGRDPRPADEPSVMFSLADPRLVTRILTRAGLSDVRLTPVPRSLWFGADAAQAATAFLESGPVRAHLERTPTLPAVEAHELLEAAVAPYASADGVRIPGAHWLVEARPGAGS